MTSLFFVCVHVGGEDVWVNAHRVIRFAADGTGSSVVLSFGPPLHTQETPEEIADLLRQAADPDEP